MKDAEINCKFPFPFDPNIVCMSCLTVIKFRFIFALVTGFRPFPRELSKEEKMEIQN